MTVAEVIAIVANETGQSPAHLGPSTSFFSLGLDSLEYVSLMVELGVPREKFHQIDTIGDIAESSC
jgi:acyl carrier protein